jgi:hypothetical protein
LRFPPEDEENGNLHVLKIYPDKSLGLTVHNQEGKCTH